MSDEPDGTNDPATVPNQASPESATKTKAHMPASDQKNEVSKLTPEEQLALFEKELKENDWGHQPC